MDLSSLFRMGLEQNATELIFSTESPIVIKKSGEIKPITNEPLGADLQKKILEKIASGEQLHSFWSEKRDMDLAVEIKEVGRFRLNLFHQEKGFTMVFRPVRQEIPQLSSLGLPDSVFPELDKNEGLIIINGAPGSGKSTLFASLIEHINNHRRCVVVSLEKPVEYLFTSRQSLVIQREIGKNAESFTSALDVIHHQNPEVIAIDDLEGENVWMHLLKLGMTKHQVIVTMGMTNSIQALEFILHQFPDFQRKQVLNLMSASLKLVISQQLIYGKEKQPLFLREVLVNNQNIMKLFLEDKLFMLPTAMKSGIKDGQMTFGESMKQFFEKDLIDMPKGEEISEEVERSSADLAALEKQLYDGNIEVRKKGETELKKLAADGNKTAKQILDDFSRFFITNFENQKRHGVK
ncbi:MAG: ATPase, T2SS/T4P/T4SS family [Candidatus Wallbacteria bacterium]|nr:ATPase, T2SS/T4P/T4SS family [Candidatus Wallbacteria bacterium]